MVSSASALVAIMVRKQTTPDHLQGAEILLEAHTLVTGQRQNEYAHPTEDYTKVCDIFHALTGITLTVEQALLFMVSVKMARLRTNIERGILHRDSVVDATGYLACLAMHHAKIAEA
jgi:hypothetical protein